MRVRNWNKFQHYKDRCPPWIKLYHELLNDVDWHELDGVSAKRLAMIWLVASETDGNIPDTHTLSFRLRITEEECRETLAVLHKWVEPGENESTEQWPSRYIPAEVRERVLKRDGSKCVFCVATENLEIDHIIPVSKGGTSQEDNLQTLCRSCNRTKRTRVANATKSVAAATQGKNLRSIEAEAEAEAEQETNTEKEAEAEQEKPNGKTVTPAAAFLAIGFAKPFGHKPFRKVFLEKFSHWKPGVQWLTDVMEETGQECERLGIKVPPQFWDGKRDVEAKEMASLKKRVPL